MCFFISLQRHTTHPSKRKINTPTVLIGHPPAILHFMIPASHATTARPRCIRVAGLKPQAFALNPKQMPMPAWIAEENENQSYRGAIFAAFVARVNFMDAMVRCRQHVYRHCQLNPEEHSFICEPPEDDAVMTRWLFAGQGYNQFGQRAISTRGWACAQAIPSGDGTLPHRCDETCSAIEIGKDVIMCLESGEVHICTLGLCPYTSAKNGTTPEDCGDVVVCPVSAFVLGVPTVVTLNHDTADINRVLYSRASNRHIRTAVVAVVAEEQQARKRMRITPKSRGDGPVSSKPQGHFLAWVV